MNRHEEHGYIRRFLRAQGSTFAYSKALLPDPDRPYQIIPPLPAAATNAPTAVRVPATRVAPRPAVRPAEPSRPAGPSALDFALLGAETPPTPRPEPRPAPAPPRPTVELPFTPPPEPPRVVIAPPAAPVIPSMSAFLDAQIELNPARELVSELALKGFRCMIKDGKLFVTNASQLTPEMLERVKTLKPEILKLDLPWHEETAPTKPPSLTTFLSQAGPAQQTTNWTAQEPPRIDDPVIVVNFETNGLEWVNGKHRPIGVTVGTIDGKLQRYLPFAHRGGGNLDEVAVVRYLKSLRGKHIINANTRFDLHMGHNLGIDFEEQDCTVSDIQHTAALLDDHRKQFRIDVLAKDYLPGGVQVPRVDESRMEEYHASYVAQRAEYQAKLIADLYEVMYPQLAEQDLLDVQRLEDDVIYPVVEMEKNGAPIDLELLEQFTQDCQRRHPRLLMEISSEVGFAFDHTSKAWRRLFEKLDLPIARTENDKDTFADGILSKIDHPLVRKGHLASQLASLNSKIFKPYNEMLGPDGILRFDLHQLRGDDGGTVTGRFSAGYIQQVPNHGNHAAVFGEDLFPRRLYVPANGNRYFAADAAQIQYRIFAHHASNPRILAMYEKDPWASFHKMIMGFILPHKPDLIYEHLKAMNFMKIFGGKLLKVAEMMGYITSIEAKQIRAARAWQTDPRLEHARQIEEIYAREVPEIEPMLRKASHLAMSHCDDWCNKTKESQELHRQFPHRGFVRTIKKRRSRFPDNYRLHKAFCMIDQGTEGDIVKTKIVELHKARKHTGLLMRMTVHDEITGDAQSPETLTRVNEILNQQSFPELKVPILWECKEGANWAECK